MKRNISAMSWCPGDSVVYEGTGLGKLLKVVPVRVVADEPHLLALYFAEGTTYLDRIMINGDPIPRVISPAAFADLATQMVKRQYPGRSLLVLTRPGDAHAVHISWEMPGWHFLNWYVNLQTPMERTERGFRSTDQYLDIVVQRDLSWKWKDEDELEEAVTAGCLIRKDADEVIREGERVVADVEAGRFPFDASLIGWRPNPAWPLPELIARRTGVSGFDRD
jgi:hypothetical protein